MIKRYQNGTTGQYDLGTQGGTPKPYNLSGLQAPLFVIGEYANTVGNTGKQLRGTINTLHSLRMPSYGPQLINQMPNYNAIDQQYIDAEESLMSTPILGTSIDQQIAQQQALSQQRVGLNKQRIRTLGQMQDAAAEQALKIDYQNAVQNHEVEEARRTHENGVRQSVQDAKDSATAIYKNAATAAASEFNKLWQMQEHRKNMRDLTDLKYNYEKELSDKLALRKNEFDQAISQDFRDQFDKDANEIEDIEDFVAKYGFDYTQFTPSEIYLTDEYKTAFDEYAKTREAEWLQEKQDINTLLSDKYRDRYLDLYTKTMKKGGSVKNTTSSKRSLTAEERIAIDNTKALHEFVKQMNQAQKEIFLKLMSL